MLRDGTRNENGRTSSPDSLTVWDALSHDVVCVLDDEKPARVCEGRGSVFAVFSRGRGGTRFVGLVTQSDLARFPFRIFADLLEENRYPDALVHSSAQVIYEHLERYGLDVASVFDLRGEFFGVVTRNSLLATLLARTTSVAMDLKSENARLQRASGRYGALLERSPVGAYIVENQLLSYVNPRFAQMLGYDRSEIQNVARLIDLINSDDRDYVAQRIEACVSGYETTLTEQIEAVCSDGDRLPAELFGTCVEIEGRYLFTGTMLEQSQQTGDQDELRYLAHHDTLTGLLNRTQFTREASAALARAQRDHHLVAVLFLDLNDFKEINDTLGHEAGDEVLKEVARRFRERLREYDLVSRWSGDEFCILLPDLTTTEECAAVAQGLLETLYEPMQAGSGELIVTASMGVSFYPNDSVVLSDLLQYADMAMYEAKQQGGGVTGLSPGAGSIITRRMKVSSHIKEAFNRGEFFLEFQPVVDFEADRVLTVEALLRWHHPEIGLLRPTEFVPLLDHHGLTERSLKWVVSTALRTYREWAEEGCAPGHIAVNMHARLLRDLKVVEIIRRSLDDSGVGGQVLSLDLRNDIFGGRVDTNRFSEVLGQLHELGVDISLDDFGVERTSLSEIRFLPLSSLKIDGSLIQGMEVDRQWESVVQAVVSLGANLGLHTVAEGVETPAQMEFLRRRGCSAGQGYYICPPMPRQAMSDWLAFAQERGWQQMVWQ